MTFHTDDEHDRAAAKPRPKGKIPHIPDRQATLSELRGWISDAAGLPPEVRIETVHRAGREPEDPVTIVLSNGMSLRCPHQKWLQQNRTLQAFLASESDGIADTPYLSPPEVGDFYKVLCRLGTASAKADPVGDLHERLLMFVAIAEPVTVSLADRAERYTTILRLRERPAFDRSAALEMRNGQPQIQPALVVDPDSQARYIRASEWVTYLRFVLGRTVNESGLVAHMSELGSERVDTQAWNLDRSHKVHLVFYTVPGDK